MPRKRVRAKSRNFKPTEADLCWLLGRPYPEGHKESFGYTFGRTSLIHIDNAMEPGLMRPAYKYRPITPEDVISLKPGERGLRDELLRLRDLYDNAPLHIREQIPDDRAALLEAVSEMKEDAWKERILREHMEEWGELPEWAEEIDALLDN